MAHVADVGNVEPQYASKLLSSGVGTTARLLKVAAHRQGRQDLAQMTGIPEKLILEWVHQADLMRIKGIGPEYGRLLGNAGVDTVRELRTRRPDALHRTLLLANNVARLVRRVPPLPEVERWVRQAKQLPPVVKD